MAYKTQIKELIRPGFYSVLCQIIENHGLNENQPYLIVSDGTTNSYITEDRSCTVHILLENINKKFTNLCEGIVVEFRGVKVKRRGRTCYLSLDCVRCRIQSVPFLQRQLLKLKVSDVLRSCGIASQFQTPLKNIIQNSLSLSLEISEGELKKCKEISSLYTSKNAQIFTKISQINEKTQTCSIYGYIVKVTRRMLHVRNVISSTIHIVDETTQFGSYFLVHLLATCQESPIPPQLHNIIKITDMIVYAGKKSRVPFGVATSKKNITLFSLVGTRIMKYNTASEIVRVTGVDKCIWNILRTNQEKEIHDLNSIMCTGYFRFVCKVSALSLDEERPLVLVHIYYGSSPTCEVEMQLLNLTPSFKDLKVGDHITLSRVRIEKMPLGGLSFIVDCKCCQVEIIE